VRSSFRCVADCRGPTRCPSLGCGAICIVNGSTSCKRFNAPQMWSNTAFNGSAGIYLADVNGDGKADLVAVNYNPSNNIGSTWVMTSSGNGFNAPQMWSNTAFNGTVSLTTGDVNGDRKADLVAVNYNPSNNTGSTWVMTSSGNGFNAPQMWSNLAFFGNRAMP
jgi:FG-GAP-like repeat